MDAASTSTSVKYIRTAAEAFASVDWIGNAQKSALSIRSAVAAFAPEPIADAIAALDPNSRLSFSTSLPFETRRSMFNEIKQSYPRHIPVIIERMNGSRLGIPIKRKYLITKDTTLSMLSFIVRKQIPSIRPSDTILIFSRSTGQPTIGPTRLADLYAMNADADGFLYLVYREENVFG